jgi:RNase P/RNase MRP subunit POP5
VKVPRSTRLRQERPEVTYQFIREHSSVFPVEKMCQTLRVSRSGYYAWKDRPPSKRELENQAIEQIARKSYADNHGMCGLNKMLADVQEIYPKCSRNHSDRGVQYCSKEYQELLKKNHMSCSMRRKGNCYDNACAETFFGTIKCELICHKRYKTRSEAHGDIFWYIEAFYNRKRRHQALGYLSPAEFKRRYLAKIAA